MVAADGRPGSPVRVREWLRAGYPGGIPEQDQGALLGILERVLPPADLAQVALDVLAGPADRHAPAPPAQPAAAPSLDAVLRVASRLLAVVLDEPPAAMPDAGAAERSGLVRRTVDWLRRGYPDGLREPDYIPLVALLRRRLTDDEVAQVAEQLRAEGLLTPDRVDIGTAVARVTEQLPTQDDLERVQGHLGDRVRPSGPPAPSPGVE